MVAKALKKMNYEENDDEKTYVVAKPKVPKVKLLVKINYAETLALRFLTWIFTTSFDVIFSIL